MKEEIWKAVEGYEDYYEVSSYGNVRSLDRIVVYSDGRKRLHKGSILKAEKVRSGYLRIALSKSSKLNKVMIHRLIAQAFIPNPSNLPEVNHKDENKTNNCTDNLEWCTRLYNINYGTGRQRRTEKLLNSPKFSKPVFKLDLETNQIIDEYPSAMEAERQLNIFHCNISACCKGKRETAGGFKWKFKE